MSRWILLVLTGSALIWSGCRRLGRAERESMTMAKGDLQALAVAIAVTQREYQDMPAVSMEGLVDWLHEKWGKHLHDVDYDRKVIRDWWDSPIVLVVEEGKLKSLGSRGPNGQWEDGSGDDIVVTIKWLEQSAPAHSATTRANDR